jgi:hypothetical protein
MSEGDDPKKARRLPRRRVTLNLESTPLLLPGENGSAPPSRETAELVLPPDAPPSRQTPLPLDDEDLAGEDGWARQRPITKRAPRPSVVPQQTDGDGGALDLVDRRSRPSSPAIDVATEMFDRYELGDYSGALVVAELILGREPEHGDALRIAKACRDRLSSLYTSRLGALSRVPRVAVDASEVRWLGLDHRAAFLLSRIDGTASLAEILDVSGMGQLEALKTLVELVDLGAIAFED